MTTVELEAPTVVDLGPASPQRTSFNYCPPLLPPQVSIQADRYVAIDMYAAMTGFTEKAIRRKIERGVWLEKREFFRIDGRIVIDREAIQKWITRGGR